jgi:biotin transport system substrate-specific component
MTERAAAPSDGKRMTDRPIQIISGAGQRRAVVETERQVRGNGRGERAPRTMRVFAGNPGRSKLEAPVARTSNIDGVGSVQVSTLDEYDAGAEREDPPARSAHVLDRPNRHAGQGLGLWHIGRYDMCAGQQLSPEGFDRVLLEQPVAAFGDHDRVEDHVGKIDLRDRRRNRLDNGGVCEHADFHGVSADIARHRLNLGDDEICGQRLPHRDAESVLRGDGRDDRRAVDLVRGKRFQVRLNSRTPARITPRNCQCCAHTVRFPNQMAHTTNGVTLLTAVSSRADMGTGIRIAAVLFTTVLTAVAAQISIPLPFTPVPFTLQPMVVLLGGAALGARLGMASQVLYLLAGAAGLPVFATSPVLPQGVLRMVGPTGGFLMAYPFAAFLTGWLAERGFDRRYLTSVIAMAAGLSLVFACGIVWLAWFARPAPAGLPNALRLGLYPFIAVDILKILLAASVLPAVWKFTGRG